MTDMETVKARYPYSWQSGTGHVWMFPTQKHDFPMSEPLGDSWASARASIEACRHCGKPKDSHVQGIACWNNSASTTYDAKTP